MKEIQKEQTQKQLKSSEIILLVIITSIIGFILGLSIFKVMQEETQEKTTIKNYDELAQFIETYNYIVDNYYGDLDRKELIHNAISGMIDSIDDPYTTYIDETGSNTFNTTLEGSFEGIGIEIVNDSDNNVVVYNVISDSPAEKAGIKILDIIIGMNGKSLEGVTTSEFVEMIKNTEDSKITLQIKRDNGKLDIEVTRQLVVIPSVESAIFEKEGQKIGYIYISIFANNTYSQFKTQLESLEKNGIDSLIIDIRSNTGGHLTAVENILSLFLDSSHIIYQTEDKDGIEKIYSKGNETKQYNIVVLTNESSASASEILAAALSEEYGATLVGKTTYGKGTVQELKTLPDGEQYKFTTKKWLTPQGIWINKVGVEVNVEVEFNKDYYENPTHDNDQQLQEAINTILKYNA